MGALDSVERGKAMVASSCVCPCRSAISLFSVLEMSEGQKSQATFSYFYFLRSRTECLALSRTQGDLAFVSHEREKVHSQNFLFRI